MFTKAVHTGTGTTLRLGMPTRIRSLSVVSSESSMVAPSSWTSPISYDLPVQYMTRLSAVVLPASISVKLPLMWYKGRPTVQTDSDVAWSTLVTEEDADSERTTGV